MTDEELGELIELIRTEAKRIDRNREIQRRKRLEFDLEQMNMDRDTRLLRRRIYGGKSRCSKRRK